MAFRPVFPGEYPTLGHAMLEWYTANLAAPDRPDYHPIVLTREQAEFVLRYYRLNPRTGKRVIRRGVLMRPKGWGKSPFLSLIAAGEALGPVVFDGWDADGRPVGKPWRMVRTPIVQIAAVSEDQTSNAWDPLLEMLREGPVLDNYPGLDPLDTFVVLPGRGKARIMPVTSSALSREGGKPVFALLDQTESWLPSNGGVRLAQTLRRNTAKVGGSTIEAPNAFVPGAGSVAERSSLVAQAIEEGKPVDPGVLYDVRPAPPDTDLGDKKSLRAGLAVAYGDSADLAKCVIHDPPCRVKDGWPRGWVDLDRQMADIYDPDNDPEDSRRFFLNQTWAAPDAWLSSPEWWAQHREDDPIKPGDEISIGFDGSRSRQRGVTDATALIGCRIRDGRLFTIRVWEQPEGPAGQGWVVPTTEVDAEVGEAFKTYKVVAMYCDPAKWETWVAKWEAAYGSRLKVKASRANPMVWWMTGGRSSAIVQATAQLHGAILDGEATHDGSGPLSRHMLNARRRETRSGTQIHKESPDSVKKIDAAIAAILAWQARINAMAAGVGRTTKRGLRRLY